MSCCIGIDIGGTNTVIGLIGPDGRIARRAKIATQAADGPDRILDRIAAQVNELLNESGMSKSSVAAIGMGVPGFIDHEQGIAVSSVNLYWKNVPVAEGIRQRLGIPAYINNDVRMYVYGEAAQGAGKGFRHVLGVTVGTGLAAGVVSEGKLYHGGGNMAGELGHIPLEGIPYTCNCGLTGCLETVASATGIVRQAMDRIREGRPTVLRQWFSEETMSRMQAKDISRAYDLGDEVAVEVMNTTGTYLGLGLAYAVTLFSPDVVIIGGGVAAAGERLLAPVREAMKSRLIRNYWDRIRVVTAELGDDAGVIGSGLYAKEREAFRRIQ